MATQEVLSKIEELRKLAKSEGVDIADQIKSLEVQLNKPATEPDAFPAWYNVQLSRRQDRPKPQDFVDALIDGFIELKGDRFAGDDKAILGGIGTFEGRAVTVISTRRGSSLQTNMEYNFGMPHPEGYRKAMRLIQQAAKFHRPVILFVDTPGAYPGVDSEDHGISEAIARNLFEMIDVPVPIVTTITGEGGSGGALALSVADRILMMENAIFSVISPEGCASILFKDSTQAPRAAQSLKLDAKSLKELGLIDAIISEGDGLHVSPKAGMDALRAQISKDLQELSGQTTETLLENRYRKFREMGRVLGN
jgi:acetyl-CoA carboxylase carboxyl transferase subunit alpha